jgi:hypothetical protein
MTARVIGLQKSKIWTRLLDPFLLARVTHSIYSESRHPPVTHIHVDSSSILYKVQKKKKKERKINKNWALAFLWILTLNTVIACSCFYDDQVKSQSSLHSNYNNNIYIFFLKKNEN